MKKSAKLSLAITLMMGVTAGSQMAGMNTASAEVSDKFSLEVNGVTSYFHDPDGNYYGGHNVTRVDGTRLQNGWSNYTRVVFNYKVDKDTSLHARVHSGYDKIGDYYINDNSKGTYFDQSYLQYHDRKSNLNYIVGKKGATLGQSMVFNSTGNWTGVQVSLGNWYDPECLQLFWDDNNSGGRMLAAQYSKSTSKATSFTTTYLKVDTEYNKKTNASYTYLWANVASDGTITFSASKDKTAVKSYQVNTNTVYKEGTSTTTKEKDKIWDIGMKTKFHGVTLVGEYAYNTSTNTPKAIANSDSSARKGWFAELYTGPTNDFGSGLPLQKPGTHVLSVRYQDLGVRGSYSHNNTFYDDKKGVRIDYGYTIKKGLSADLVVGRMKDKGTDGYDKGKMSNIIAASLNYKFK